MINYGKHLVDESDVDAVVDVLRSDFLTQGPKLKEFENAIAKYVGARFAVGVSSGTAGLHLACLAVGIGPSDKVVTSPNTFAASANCALYLDAEPVFADIDAVTLNISPDQLGKICNSKKNIKAIIPVHFGGLTCEMHRITPVVRNIGASIIEDAAHALGGTYSCGARVGSCKYSDLTVFSLHPIKTITAGEGGIITTNDESLYHKLLLLRNHGIERNPDNYINAETKSRSSDTQPWYYEQQMLGFNYRLSDLHAALGLSQLARIDDFVEFRRQVAQRYDEEFSDLKNITVAQNSDDARNRSALHLYVVKIDLPKLGITRSEVMQKLHRCGIGTQVHYIPVYRHPLYRTKFGNQEDSYPIMEAYYSGCLSLPMHTALSESDIKTVIKAVTKLDS